MKLKQALAIGLSTTILAISAFAGESVNDLNSLPAANVNQQADVATPAKKEAVHHKKGHKKNLVGNKEAAKEVKENAKLDELNTLDSAAETTN